MINVGIIGSTGYAGAQLVWLLHNHSKANIKFYSSHNYAEINYNEIYKNFYEFIDSICIDMDTALKSLDNIHVLFIALPHGKAIEIAKIALSKGVKVIDLGADFRLKSKETYEDWYNVKHTSSNLLEDSIYGLTELNRDKIKNCNLLANPGCYPTATILALAPLLKNNLINKDSIIIDAKSGVSGAGRSANVSSLFVECNESMKAYAIANHRHTPEIEQELGVILNEDLKVLFTPHLVPMNRGILSTCYGTLKETLTLDQALNLYRDFYKDEYFVKILDTLPETRWVKGSNLCHIGLTIDSRTNRIIVTSVIDNLVKGAAGQAVQNMNLMFELDEKTGLELISMAP